MNQRELRLGNYIIEDGKQTEFDGDFYHWCDDIMKPIPLTEEWMIKFGFEKVVYNDEQHGYGTEYHLEVNSDVFLNYADDFSLTIFGSKASMKDEIGVFPKWETIETVHGLQNLYFALTGEELEVK